MPVSVPPDLRQAGDSGRLHDLAIDARRPKVPSGRVHRPATSYTRFVKLEQWQ